MVRFRSVLLPKYDDYGQVRGAIIEVPQMYVMDFQVGETVSVRVDKLKEKNIW